MRYCKVLEVFLILRGVLHGPGVVAGLDWIIRLEEYLDVPVSINPKAGSLVAVFAHEHLIGGGNLDVAAMSASADFEFFKGF